jgi:CheY-like chemotaxis protein
MRATDEFAALRSAAMNEHGAERPNPLAGACILIAEDEPLVAMLVEESLMQAGAREVLSATRWDDALAFLSAPDRVSAAVLDLSLGGGTGGLTLARMATSARIPFIFGTGYGRETLPPEFSDIQLVGKPYNFAALVEALKQAMARPRG